MKKLLAVLLTISSSSFATEFSTKIIVDDSFENKPVVILDNVLDECTGKETTQSAQIQTVTPNAKGVSFNNFSEFGIKSETWEDQVTNINTDANTKMIVFNVTGEKGSYVMTDVININNPKTDFIFANKNGYIFSAEMNTTGKVGFITDSVSLTDGKIDMAKYKEKFNAGSLYLYANNPVTETRFVIGGDLIDKELNAQLIDSFFGFQMVSVDEDGNIQFNYY